VVVADVEGVVVPTVPDVACISCVVVGVFVATASLLEEDVGLVPLLKHWFLVDPHS
jgi:hypothetical protein